VVTTAGQSDEDQFVSHEGIPDPSDLPSLCDEDEFAEMVANMVADEAPRLFAIVAEYGDRVDAGCAAWGLAFDDGVEVVSVDSKKRFSLATPEDAVRRFGLGVHITPRLVWVDPTAATSRESDE
jgi:hypothetical protein